MALRIWCNPMYFPVETQARAVAAAASVLSARGVTLEQAREAYAYAERFCDLTEERYEPPAHTREWEADWFDAIAAGVVAADVPSPYMGAMLVLDDADERLGGHDVVLRPDLR